ncbi:hypothetical protein SDJN02_13970, partial [Cucurbita argyrosperma subsp. argyrosperma]
MRIWNPRSGENIHVVRGWSIMSYLDWHVEISCNRVCRWSCSNMGYPLWRVCKNLHRALRHHPISIGLPIMSTLFLLLSILPLGFLRLLSIIEGIGSLYLNDFSQNQLAEEGAAPSAAGGAGGGGATAASHSFAANGTATKKKQGKESEKKCMSSEERKINGFHQTINDKSSRFNLALGPTRHSKRLEQQEQEPHLQHPIEHQKFVRPIDLRQQVVQHHSRQCQSLGVEEPLPLLSP